jgi:hypothetical protein
LSESGVDEAAAEYPCEISVLICNVLDANMFGRWVALDTHQRQQVFDHSPFHRVRALMEVLQNFS